MTVQVRRYYLEAELFELILAINILDLRFEVHTVPNKAQFLSRSQNTLALALKCLQREMQ